MKKYEYLLIDADNTLFDFDRCERAAFNIALNECGIPSSDGIYEEYHLINDSLWKLLEKGGITREALKTERYRILFERHGITDGSHLNVAGAYERALGRQVFEIPGSYELLKKLFGKVRTFVVTNGLTSVQSSRFSISRLTPFIEKVFISEAMGAAKPDPGFFDGVIDEIGDGDLSKYLVVGDSLSSDIDGAIRYGIDSCWFSPRGGDCGGRCPTYVIGDLSELDGILGL